MNLQNAINEIHALVANSEVNDAVAERLLTIAYWLEIQQTCAQNRQIYSENNPDPPINLHERLELYGERPEDLT